MQGLYYIRIIYQSVQTLHHIRLYGPKNEYTQFILDEYRGMICATCRKSSNLRYYHYADNITFLTYFCALHRAYQFTHSFLLRRVSASTDAISRDFSLL